MNVKEYIKSWAESYKKDLTENIMPFWMKHGWDRENGGVYTCVDRDGSLMGSTHEEIRHASSEAAPSAVA